MCDQSQEPWKSSSSSVEQWELLMCSHAQDQGSPQAGAWCCKGAKPQEARAMFLPWAACSERPESTTGNLQQAKSAQVPGQPILNFRPAGTMQGNKQICIPSPQRQYERRGAAEIHI